MDLRTTCRGILTIAAGLGAALALALPGSSRAALADEPVVEIIYVDADASAGGDGQSWSTAYRYVQDALDEANAHGDKGYEMWVAEGVYYPDQDGDGDHLNDVVTETFRIGYNNVQLYGGFAGVETAREQRDWRANVTVLSGDIDGDDATDAHGVVITTTDIAGWNAYHVLWLDGETKGPITGRTIIDGFTITAGDADGSPRHDKGGGMTCAGSGAECSPTLSNVTFSGNWASSGGAMFNDARSGASSPTLTNVAFSGNSAEYLGGAIYNEGCLGLSSPTLALVTFRGNAAGNGGAMFNDGHQGGTSSPTLTNVTFSGNSARWDGGAMYNGGTSGASSPTLTNVTFSGNSAEDYGGAMVNNGTHGGSSDPTLTNVTFTANSAHLGGGAVLNFGSELSHSAPTLANVILWGNTTGGEGDQMYNRYATPAIGYSLVEGGWDGSGIYNRNSSVTDNGGNIDADPQFLDADDGNLRLRVTSPAIDAGDNSAVPPGVTTDRDGHARFVDIPTIGDRGNGTPPIVDMGAYEAQNLQHHVYVPMTLRNHQ